jgi:oxygen-independent coproporphyrinogen-3 oxidase
VAGIYLHVPFCRVRCPYCDFNTWSGVEDRIPAYVDALEIDLRRQLRAWPVPYAARTVYFGGGTPSLLPPSAVRRLLDVVRQEADVDALEVTLEANPGTVDEARISGFLEAGVNRLTLGAQTFDPALLARLGRLHSVEQTRQAIAAARAAGVRNLNLDLMFALPDQRLEAWEADLAEAMEHRPEHLSLYNLTIEDRTPFGREQRQGTLQQPDEEVQRAMHLAAWAAADQAGLERYEVSNFARPGHACEHNRIYWRGEPWLAIGSGAHGHRPPFPGETGFGRRWWVVRGIGEYIARVRDGRSTEEDHEDLDREAAMTEEIMLGLRQRSGLDRAAFAARFGVDPVYALGPALVPARDAGLLALCVDRIQATEDGEIILDFVISQLVAGLDTAEICGNDGPSTPQECASGGSGPSALGSGAVGEMV